MSRCFPFPPPGYERKTKVDDSDLLKKEKQKEKKHKKEKKDKEKKEGKEKREKERSDEKHREKKDKKEKHRDKNKDKEKDRDKDRHKSDILHPDAKKVVGSADNHVHKLSEKSKEKETDRNPISADKRIGGVSGVHNGMPVIKNNHQLHETKSFKCMPDLGRKSTDEERRMPNQSSDKIVGAEKKKDGVVMLAAKGEGLLQDTRERTKEKPAFDGRLDGQGVIGDARSTGSALVSNSVGVVQNRVVGSTPVEKKIEQKMDGKEKSREKGDERKGEKRKERDREKSSLKDKDRKKEKREITKTLSEEKHVQMIRMKDGGENNMLKSTVKDFDKKDNSGVRSAGFYNITKDSNHHAAMAVRMKDGGENNMLKSTVKDFDKDSSGVQSAGFYNMTKDSNHHAAIANNNFRKRKDPGLNGIYDELVTGPNKLARASASPHSLTENGRSLEPCQNSSAQRVPLNIKVEPKLTRVDSMQKPPLNLKVEPKLPHVDSMQKPPMNIRMEPKLPLVDSMQKPPMNIRVEPKLPHVDSMQKPPMNVRVEPKLPHVDSMQKPPMNIRVEPKLPHVDSVQKPPMKIKVDEKECKINGTVPETSTQSSRETKTKERKHSDTPAKPPPPHPDTKYLSQVLSVPKMNEWPEVDNQDWLFDSSSSLTRKPEANSSLMDDTPQVWARGSWLEPVDMFALPYVIPH